VLAGRGVRGAAGDAGELRVGSRGGVWVLMGIWFWRGRVSRAEI